MLLFFCLNNNGCLMSSPLYAIPQPSQAYNHFNITISSKPGTIPAACFGTIAIVLAIIALAMSIIFILGATGVIPAVSSLVAISSLGTSLGLTAAMAVICTINISIFSIMAALGILLIRYAHGNQTLHFVQENNS